VALEHNDNEAVVASGNDDTQSQPEDSDEEIVKPRRFGLFCFVLFCVGLLTFSQTGFY